MFTGIVEELGTVISLKKGSKSAVLVIQGSKIFDDLKLGDSVAVNGVCLTATSISGKIFHADVMNETLQRTSLGCLTQGSKVNLERAMAANGRFGGHIVSGHIDGTGTIESFVKDGIATIVSISTTPQIAHYIIEKGSIAIDGTSLTVTEVNLDKNTFSVSLIPHTKENTILLSKKSGDAVNLENDIIAKYLERFVKPAPQNETAKSRITEEFLAKCGF